MLLQLGFPDIVVRVATNHFYFHFSTAFSKINKLQIFSCQYKTKTCAHLAVIGMPENIDISISLNGQLISDVHCAQQFAYSIFGILSV